MSGQFGTGAKVSYGHFGTSGKMSWVRSVLTLTHHHLQLGLGLIPQHYSILQFFACYIIPMTSAGLTIVPVVPWEGPERPDQLPILFLPHCFDV